MTVVNGKPKFTILNMSSGNYYYEVHKAGCRDIAKKLGSINGKYDKEAENVDALVDAEIKDLADGSDGDLQFQEDDFNIYPCARGGV